MAGFSVSTFSDCFVFSYWGNGCYADTPCAYFGLSCGALGEFGLEITSTEGTAGMSFSKLMSFGSFLRTD